MGNGGSGASIGGSSGVLDNGSLVFNLPRQPRRSAAPSAAAASLTQAGSGVLTLLGSNTYTGDTTISAGTLQLGNGGSGASIGNTNGVLDNSSLVFFHGDSVTFLPAISGSGNLTQAGSGVLTLLGNNTYSGSTTVSGGTLQVGNGGGGEFLASPSVSLSNSAALVFNQSDVQTYGGVISGVGNVTLTGTDGLLTLLGSNTYTGNTTVSGGTLQIGSGGSGAFLASPSISLSNSAALVFSQSDSQIYGGVISGSGNVAMTGSGLLTLLGSNTYSGTTTISGGTLQVGNGIAAATLGTGAVTDNSAPCFQPPRRLDFWRRHQRQGQPDAGRHRPSDPAGQQHLHWRHDDLDRHAPARQRRDVRGPDGRRGPWQRRSTGPGPRGQREHELHAQRPRRAVEDRQ